MKYQANPVIVDGYKIEKITMGDGDMLGTLKLEATEGKEFIAEAGHIARYVPQVNDYWVIQSDGYEYVNPREVFERKYSPLDEKAAL